ncbi:MAG: SsrA-binding protein SmpB [Verrucomicrobiota bacterium]
MSSRELINRKAGRDYHVIESLEAGIALSGTEVKSLRDGQANFNDAFARVDQGQVWLHNFHISPYEKGNRENHEPKRQRRLLLHKNQIRKLHQEISQSGCTVVPLKGYFKNRYFKVLIGICKGKTHGDKRQTLKKRESDREMRRAISNQMRGR